MHAYYSTNTCWNPLAPTRTSRFTAHLTAITEPTAAPDSAGHYKLNSPFSLGTGDHLPGSHSACPITAGQDALSSNQLRRKPRNLSNPAMPGWAAA